MNPSLIQRMNLHVERRGESDCWEWKRFRDRRTGYGVIGDGERIKKAHRVAWEIANGPIPEGLKVLHRCDNPPCCNPAHLFLGTQADNVRDMVVKGRHVPPRPSRGEAHYNAKITDAEADYIRNSTERGIDLAARFGLAPSTVCQIRKGVRRIGVAA